MNGIETAVKEMKKVIDSRLETGEITQDQVDEMSKTLDMPLEDYCRFQELKSLAVAEKTISLEVGNYVYRLLGTNPGHFNAQPLEVKHVLTCLLAELCQRQIKQHS